MRTGETLHSDEWIPEGVRDAPIVLTRTPYNAAQRVMRN